MQLIPKPSRSAQAAKNGAKKVPLSDVYATLKRKLWTDRSWEKTDIAYSAFMLVIHGLCLFAPATFSWPMVGLFFASYFVTGQSCHPSHSSLLLNSTRPINCICCNHLFSVTLKLTVSLSSFVRTLLAARSHRSSKTCQTWRLWMTVVSTSYSDGT